MPSPKISTLILLWKCLWRNLPGNWEKFSAINKRGELGAYKQRIMEKWSIKDYNEVSYPSDKLFFESFESLVQPLWDILEGLLELKNRAIKKT
jgi:adenosine deaminase/adenosine deaminase CECR1